MPHDDIACSGRLARREWGTPANWILLWPSPPVPFTDFGDAPRHGVRTWELPGS